MKLSINGNTATTVTGIGVLLSQILVLTGTFSQDTALQVSTLIAGVTAVLYKGNPQQ